MVKNVMVKISFLGGKEKREWTLLALFPTSYFQNVQVLDYMTELAKIKINVLEFFLWASRK